MRKIPVALVTVVFAALSAAAFAQTSPTITPPDKVVWSSSGLPKGISVATLAGNPNGTGMYVQRLKMDAGTSFPPHAHGKAEMVTVLSGTLWAGIGSKMDKSKMKPLAAGTFIIMPAGVPHYVMAKEATVIEVSGMGPASTHMLGGGSMKM